MLSISEIYKKFEMLHSYSFSTINDGYPELRVAHFITYDNEGLYFQTMKVKPFYKQLKDTNKVAVLSMVSENKAVEHDEKGLSEFPPGFFIRVKGDVKEIDFDTLSEKAAKDERFLPLVKDIERYPTMTTFVLYRFSGEIYDFDYEKVNRDNKLDRQRFSFNGFEYVESGFQIDKDKCIACGACYKVCTFSAIEKGKSYYKIKQNYCDECGNCYSVCPVNAIKPKVEMSEEERAHCKKVLNNNLKANK